MRASRPAGRGWAHEIVPGETIPAVTGVVGVAVNFTKGCYPGQELVERMDSRGAEAPSSLRILAIGSDVPLGTEVGHPVVDPSGATIGTITSVGTTHALGDDQARPRPRHRSRPPPLTRAENPIPTRDRASGPADDSR